MCNLLFHFLYLYNISIIFCANKLCLNFELFSLTLNIAIIRDSKC